MTDLKDSKEMYDFVEQIILDDLDKLDELHEFSDTYKNKKNIFMDKIKMKGE